MQLRINPLALEDLQQIQTYMVEELRNPDAANDTLRKIIADYKQLTDFPLLVHH